MASIELKEKNGVMTEVVRIADFEVYAGDTVTTLKVVDKGYRSAYGVWEEDNFAYYTFDFLNDFDFACEEFERVLGNYGHFDLIRVGHNAHEALFRNVMESNIWESTEGCEEAFHKFVTFAIELNMINKG
tara:strand:- start:125 stop:514 length:390 start_codon:yes stop_codon:yes gene_type:complete